MSTPQQEIKTAVSDTVKAAESATTSFIKRLLPYLTLIGGLVVGALFGKYVL